MQILKGSILILENFEDHSASSSYWEEEELIDRTVVFKHHSAVNGQVAGGEWPLATLATPARVVRLTRRTASGWDRAEITVEGEGFALYRDPVSGEWSREGTIPLELRDFLEWEFPGFADY